jgi:hypothetical protein
MLGPLSMLIFLAFVLLVAVLARLFLVREPQGRRRLRVGMLFCLPGIAGPLLATLFLVLFEKSLGVTPQQNKMIGDAMWVVILAGIGLFAIGSFVIIGTAVMAAASSFRGGVEASYRQGAAREGRTNQKESTTDKREQIKKYFQPFPTWAVVVIVIGIVLLLIPSLAVRFVGILLIGGGIAVLAMERNKPSDAQMDLWIEDDLQGLNAKALNKSGTDPSECVGEKVLVTGPRFWNVAGAPILYKKGNDNTLRFTPIGVNVINFTAHQLISYSCVLDLTTGNALNESTDEYFYKDVVSVSTQTKSLTLENYQLKSAETFVLTTSGGTSVEVVLSDPQLIEKMGGGNIPKTQAEKAIQTVRKMLREKKT